MYTPHTVVTTEEFTDGQVTRHRVITANVNNKPTEIDMEGDGFSEAEIQAVAVAIMTHGCSVSKWGIYNAIKNSSHELGELSQDKANRFAGMMHQKKMATGNNLTRAGWNWLEVYVPEHIPVTTPLPPE
jgi:hypothetical protein